MSRSRALSGFLVGVGCAIGGGAVALAQPPRLGPELQVNVFTVASQFEPALAMDGSGNFVVVWTSVGQDGAGYGIFGRRFTAAGAAIGVEFQVNTYTTSVQRSADVARDGDGDFVVVWQSFAQDGHVFGVFGQRFASSGAKQGGEFQVNVYTLGQQNAPSVAITPGGSFVVAWTSDQDGDQYGIFAKRYDSAGVAQTGEFQVNEQTVDRQRFPAVAIDTAGDFVVVWSEENFGGEISGRRFNSVGAPVAGEFRINTYTTNNQSMPSVAMASSGAFAVVWQSYGQDGSDFGIFGRRFDSSGAAQGPDFPVNSYVGGAQSSPQVSMSSGGGFVVAWTDPALDGDTSGAFGLVFNRFGGAESEGFQLNAYTTGSEFFGDVATDAGGRFVAVWISPRDGNDVGVFAQRFSTVGASVDVDGNGSAEPLTDGLLVLRYLFGFRGATLITGVVAGNCTRCTAPAIEGFLGTLQP